MARLLGEEYGKINEAAGMKKRLTMGGGGKQLFLPFIRQDFWKGIG